MPSFGPLKILDFRSDTVTRPSVAMRQRMAQAEVGDDVYGEDPTVRALEEKCAELLGLAAGLFVCSGTQGNQVAIGAVCRPGDEVMAEAGSHCLHYEGGAIAALWGAQPRALPGARGVLEPAQILAATRPHNEHFPRSRMLILENTHGRSAGAVWPVEKFRAAADAGKSQRLWIHLDGARLFNAQAATGAPVREYAKHTDSTNVALSKGLGAPVGSVLCGSAEFIAEARRIRKRLGGGMRQVGILAAAGLYALEHNVQRLGQDHENARVFAQALVECGLVQSPPFPVETNMVFCDFGRPAADLVSSLARSGVLCNAEGSHPNWVRFVLHLDLESADIPDAVERIRRTVQG